jgi:transposase InsO family protein
MADIEEPSANTVSFKSDCRDYNPIPRPRIWRKRRFQREHSNSLWRGDYTLTEDDEWMISYLDDHSRFIPGSRIHHNPTAEHATNLLVASMKQYSKPEQV